MRTAKDLEGTWTLLWDMHSGGASKTEWDKIAIQMVEEDAIRYANWRWGVHPHNVTCTCCGEDFGVQVGSAKDVLEYHMQGWDEEDVSDEKIVTRILSVANSPSKPNEYNDMSAGKKFLFVFADEAGDEWKTHVINRSGYRWDEWEE